MDHPSGRHDDHSNALAIAVSKAKRAGAAHGYPIGVGRVINPFSFATARHNRVDVNTRPVSSTACGWQFAVGHCTVAMMTTIITLGQNQFAREEVCLLQTRTRRLRRGSVMEIIVEFV